MYTHIHVHTHTCTHTYMHTHVHTLHTHINAHTYTRVYMNTHTCTHTYRNTHICTHIWPLPTANTAMMAAYRSADGRMVMSTLSPAAIPFHLSRLATFDTLLCICSAVATSFPTTYIGRQSRVCTGYCVYRNYVPLSSIGRAPLFPSYWLQLDYDLLVESGLFIP